MKDDNLKKIDELEQLKIGCITLKEAKEKFAKEKHNMDNRKTKINDNVKGISVVNIDNNPQIIKTLGQVKKEQGKKDNSDEEWLKMCSKTSNDGKLNLEEIRINNKVK